MRYLRFLLVIAAAAALAPLAAQASGNNFYFDGQQTPFLFLTHNVAGLFGNDVLIIADAAPAATDHVPRNSFAADGFSISNHNGPCGSHEFTAASEHGHEHAAGTNGAYALLHDHGGVSPHVFMSHSHNEHLNVHDHLARVEIRAYALHHLGVAAEHPHSFGTTSRWDAHWVLRWADFDHDGDLIRVYHATNKHDHQLRFTSVWDTRFANHGNWEPVR